MILTKKEIKVLISLIDRQQFDGAEWTFEGIKLNNLKKKLNGTFTLGYRKEDLD